VGLGAEVAVDAELRPWVAWGTHWSRRQGDSWTTPALIVADVSLQGQVSSLVADPVQGVWAVWSRTDIVGEDRWMSVWSSHTEHDTWTRPALVERRPWVIMWPQQPVLTAAPGVGARAVWLRLDWHPYTATSDGDSWVGHERVPIPGTYDYFSACSDSAGGYWVTAMVPYGEAESTYCARHDSVNWAGLWTLGPYSVTRGMLCCDEQGRVWALLYSFEHSHLYVRYFDGDSWSDHYQVPGAVLEVDPPRIVAAQGQVWVTWVQQKAHGPWLLYYCHTLPAGIAGDDAPPVGRVGNLPTLIRGLLVLPPAPGGGPETAGVLLDVTGRRVMALGPGENDVRHLAPGVYFFRRQDTGESCRLVLVE
jgi:hypothetical protein